MNNININLILRLSVFYLNLISEVKKGPLIIKSLKECFNDDGVKQSQLD